MLAEGYLMLSDPHMETSVSLPTLGRVLGSLDDVQPHSMHQLLFFLSALPFCAVYDLQLASLD